METRWVAAAPGAMSTIRMIIDGGGTSTAVAVFQGATERARVTLPPYRPSGADLRTEELCHHLATWCAATAIPTEQLALIVIGMAGVWTGEEKRAYTEAFRIDWESGCGTAAPHVVVLADIELVQFAALTARSGIVLIAGTGSMALGVTHTGAIVRCGGWGPRIDDAGGGFWMGREALRAVAQMIDGTAPATSLIRPVAAWLRTDAADVQTVALRLRSASIDGVARLATAVTAYAEEGDAVAAHIVHGSAAALVTLATTLLGKHRDLTPLIVRYGSVWQAKTIQQTVTQAIQERYPDAVFETVDDVLAAANAAFMRNHDS